MEAKSVRGANLYLEISSRYKKLKKNIAILEAFVDIEQLVPLDFLDKKGFDWNLFESCRKNRDGEAVYLIGNLAYRIIVQDSKQYVKIWKP